MAVDISRALDTPGWMSNLELQWLAEQAHRSKNTVEVGSWLGRSTRAMADNTTGLIFAVDTWNGTAGDPTFPALPYENYAWDEFSKNLGDHLWNGRVTAFRMTSLEAAAKFAEMRMRFDFIFIDSDHSYEAVRNDILAWRPLMRDGGIFSGHDYDWAYPGVVHAVHELVAPVPLQAANGSSIWYLHT